MKWQPQQYDRFKTERFKPLFDLISAIPNQNFEHIYDLGCGSGAAFDMLQQNWPQTPITAIDNSAAMLKKAQGQHQNIDFLEQDLKLWIDEENILPSSLILSNAALHWLDHHPKVFTGLAKKMNNKSILAVQMPNNWQAPSHQILFDQIKEPQWMTKLLPHLRENPVLAADDYHKILSPFCKTVKIWQTVYEHGLVGDDAVFNWLKGSSLQYYLNFLNPEEAQYFCKSYADKLAVAYGKNNDGTTPFTFKRLFIVAQVD